MAPEFPVRAHRDVAAILGIWHETYSVTPEQAENIYSNMPAFGLGAAIGLSPALARMGGLRDPFPRP